MRKKICTIITALGMAAGGILSLSSNAFAVRSEERVKIIPNVPDDVKFTRIVPGVGGPIIELTYNDSASRYETLESWPRVVRIGYGDFTDKQIYDLDRKISNFYMGPANRVGVAEFQAEAYVATCIWEDGETIVLSGSRIYYGIDLINGSGGRLIYQIGFTKTGGYYLGRVDYTRCIHSSVFISGLATECRMEEIGNGKVQYQPYTSDGRRVEIPAEEDAILTAATEAWDPPYGWPDLTPPEPEPVEPDPVEPEPEPVEPDPVEPEPVEPEPVEPEPVEPDPVEPEPEPEPTELSEPSEPSNSPDSSVAEIVLAGVKDIIPESSDIATEGNAEKNAKNEGHEVIMSETTGIVGSTETMTVESSEDTSALGLEKQTGAVMEKEIAKTESSSQDRMEVEVPDLGQGADKKPNIAVSVAVVLGAGVVLTAAWWFLLFGRHKSKERKEGKE
ncbi:hypothetical protein J6D24_01030 [Candidatus Saccharibacteria bacterium]|nr:hypothetical protein [Candidatus Saccharibacteria bacterium]